jgi:hypothetical protein
MDYRRRNCSKLSLGHLLNNINSCQVDFIQAFTQAPIDCPIFMEAPTDYSIINKELSFIGEDNKQMDKSHILQFFQKHAWSQTGRAQLNCNCGGFSGTQYGDFIKFGGK